MNMICQVLMMVLHADYGGAVIEFGPRSIRTAGVVGNNTLQLISDLHLEDQILSVKIVL